MHIFFSGIGGTGIGPLAIIAKQAGYTVSGSDKQSSQYTEYLQKHGIELYIGQTNEKLITMHKQKPIDWFVYSSALPLENPAHPELNAVKELDIKHSKRDEFLQYFITEKNLKLLAFAGTHGKTSSTAMAIWIANKLSLPVSYSVGAKLSFGDMGHYNPESSYFIYECDEFDKNFLAFSPTISVLTKVDWDHHEQYPTRDSYRTAFKEFCAQSTDVFAHKEEIDYLDLQNTPAVHEIQSQVTSAVSLVGEHNRRNAAGAIAAIHHVTGINIDKLVAAMASYPGSNRRFELLAPNIYSDYAHTPEEIAATLQLARELGNKLVVVYEPLTNRRQHFMKDAYKDVFKDIHALYWVPSYLAREDPDQHIITPDEFVTALDTSANAKPATLNEELFQSIIAASKDSTVILLAGGGGGSLDEWARNNLSAIN